MDNQKKYIRDKIRLYNTKKFENYKSKKFEKKVLGLCCKSGGKDLLKVSNKIMKTISLYGNLGEILFDVKNRHIINNIKALDLKSRQGYVFTANLTGSNSKIIVKIPKDHNNTTSLREYFVALFAINKLRYLLPNFMYTFAAYNGPSPLIEKKVWNGKYINNKKNMYVINEYIKGENVTTLLRTKKLTFSSWLLCFIQLLLALEVAQREVEFTHYDLHTGNVILTNQKHSYKVNAGFTTYSIKNCKLVPVIIDYGIVTIKSEKESIGTCAFKNYGMVNYMLPGYDMYKFIIFSLKNAKSKKVKNKILQLFNFYGSNDPYNVLYQSDGLNNALSEYCKKVSTSSIASYSPSMFVNWIVNTKEYTSIINPYISLTKRSNYINNNQVIISNNVDSTYNGCSYLLSEYYNKLKGIKSHNIGSINYDINILYKVFNINVPTINDIVNILNKTPNSTNKTFEKFTNFNKKINIYLQLYFTILELDMPEVYNKWVNTFTSSYIYIFTYKNNVLIERAARWKNITTYNKNYCLING